MSVAARGMEGRPHEERPEGSDMEKILRRQPEGEEMGKTALSGAKASFSYPLSFSRFLQPVALVLGLSHQRGEGAGWAASGRCRGRTERAAVQLPQEQPLGRRLIQAAGWARSWHPASESGPHPPPVSELERRPVPSASRPEVVGSPEG